LVSVDGLSNRAVHRTISEVFNQLKGGDPVSTDLAMRGELVCLGGMSEQPSAAV
jgi:hypothetical protein